MSSGRGPLRSPCGGEGRVKALYGLQEGKGRLTVDMMLTYKFLRATWALPPHNPQMIDLSKLKGTCCGCDPGQVNVNDN